MGKFLIKIFKKENAFYNIFSILIQFYEINR